MNAQLPIGIDKAAFLAWVQTRERKRYELIDGMVVEAGLHTRGHALVVGNLANALHTALDRGRWHVLLSFGVDTGPNTIRDPDVLVDCGGNAEDLTANAPVLLAEVLSPHSIETDRVHKPAEYTQLPSLLAYLVLSQDEPKAWIWLRTMSGFPSEPETIEGLDKSVQVPALSVALPLSQVYAGITFN